MEGKKLACMACLGDLAVDDIGKYLVSTDRVDNEMVRDFVEKAKELEGPAPKISVCEKCARKLGFDIAGKVAAEFPTLSLGVLGAEPKETTDE